MPNSTFNIHVGDIVPFAALSEKTNRMALTRELYMLVRRLAPDAHGKSDEELAPTALEDRPSYPWE